MAKLQDRFYNRVIEGDLELGEHEQSQVNALVIPAIAGKDIAPKDINASGDVKVKNLEVSNNSNFKGDIKLNGESALQTFDGSFNTGDYTALTISNSYIKVVRNFNELQFIFNCRVYNATENAITINNDSVLAYFNVDNEEIQNKIYSHNGDACSTDSEVTRGSIAFASLFISATNGTAMTSLMPRYVNLFHASGNFRFYVEGGNFSIGAGEAVDLEARISLAL